MISSKAMRSRKNRPRRRGVATVEFALVLPVLVLLAIMIIEGGRVLTVEQIMTNGAREGARRAVLAGATDAQVQAAIDNYMSAAGIAAGSFTRTISPTSTNAASGTAITVTVSVPVSRIFTDGNWLPLFGQADPLKNTTLSSRVVMRRE